MLVLNALFSRFNRELKVEKQFEEEALARLSKPVLSKTAEELAAEEEVIIESYRNIIKEGNFHLLHKTIHQLDPNQTCRNNEIQWDRYTNDMS